MFTVDSYVKTWRLESRICVNLFHKLPAGALDYRPTAGQRSTMELLRYLSYGPYNGVHKTLVGDWKQGPGTADMTAGMPASDFPARMAWQADAVERELRAASSHDLLTGDMTFPWNETVKKAEGLGYPLRWLIGYRMQLFLYAKSAGAHQLNTGDCWREPAPAAAPAA